MEHISQKVAICSYGQYVFVYLGTYGYGYGAHNVYIKGIKGGDINGLKASNKNYLRSLLWTMDIGGIHISEGKYLINTYLEISKALKLEILIDI